MVIWWWRKASIVVHFKLPSGAPAADRVKMITLLSLFLLTAKA
jgi:hypothetical protein